MPPAHGCTPVCRLVFDHLPVGVARCRVVRGPAEATRIEVLESNPMFAPVRDALPTLLELVDRTRTTDAATHVLQTERATFAITVLRVADRSEDEVIVFAENRSEIVRLGARSRLSQLHFDQAFHGNPAAMVIARRDDLRILEVNQRWCELFELARDEAIGRTAVALGLIDPADRAAQAVRGRA
jgi:PAS domain-containing protein